MGYVRERIELSTRTGIRMAVYCANAGAATSYTYACILVFHGQGYGSREIVGLMPDGSEGTWEPELHKDFASEWGWGGYCQGTASSPLCPQHPSEGALGIKTILAAATD